MAAKKKKTDLPQVSLLPRTVSLSPPSVEDLPALAAGLVHETKNPLASIHLHLQLLLAYIDEVEDDALRSKLKKKATFIQREISNLDETLHNFLKSIRQERRALGGSIDLNSILEGVRELLLPQARQSHIRIEMQAANPSPKVRADEGFVKQIAINLILNAIQAFLEEPKEPPKTGPHEALPQESFSKKDTSKTKMDSASPPLALSVPTDRKEKIIIIKTGQREGRAFFVVADNGPGIPEEIREKIFEPWFTSKPGKGSGIGLALVKKMVAEMGAHLELQSRTGHGSSFTVIFPATET